MGSVGTDEAIGNIADNLISELQDRYGNVYSASEEALDIAYEELVEKLEDAVNEISNEFLGYPPEDCS